jgi:hypothetical protein
VSICGGNRAVVAELGEYGLEQLGQRALDLLRQLMAVTDLGGFHREDDELLRGATQYLREPDSLGDAQTVGARAVRSQQR